ncbi:MAG: dTDP-glucose 4,6-dehydratase [Candidatus Omnitrophica bacterium]|nr:dTDP-glucose 4,6-dehydratase [Candidatus Omnitrophota bacterium]
MKSILITGGCGFIGSHFIRRFLHNNPDYHVINLDKLTYCGNRTNLTDVEDNPRYEFIQGDICDKKIVFDIAHRVSAIINFAAETHVDRSIEESEDFLRTNIVGVKTLLDATNHFSLARFVQVSTDEVYGSISHGSFTETSPLMPNSPYASSKTAGDLLARSYFVTYKTPVIITRSSNNFGPFQYPEKIVPLFITNLIEGEKVPLYAKGENMREWLYVEDNCVAIELIFKKGIVGEVYNIGSEHECTNIDLTKKILKKFGIGEEWINYVKDRPGHDYRYSLDDSKIKKIGYTPTYGFDNALDKTIEWYRKNKEWWQPLKDNRFTKK